MSDFLVLSISHIWIGCPIGGTVTIKQTSLSAVDRLFKISARAILELPSEHRSCFIQNHFYVHTITALWNSHHEQPIIF